jgi:tetratricopeptide (TPR) repeat protein
MALAGQQNAMQEQAALLNVMGLAVLAMQNPSAARSYFERALSMFRSGRNMRGVAEVLANLGNVAGFQGNYSTALDYYEQSLRLIREIGSRQEESAMLGNLGWISGQLGDFVKAKNYAAQSLQTARELGHRENETFTLINLSSYAGAMAEYDDAIDYAEQGLVLARESNDRNAEAWALTYLGHGLFDSQQLEPAGLAYLQALDLRRQLDQPATATEPAAGLARISLIKGDLPAAREQVDAILSQLEQDGTLEGTDQPLRVYLGTYLVLSTLGDLRANAILNTAHDMLKTRSNGIADPSARQAFLENIPYNREIMALWSKRHGAEPAPRRQD